MTITEFLLARIAEKEQAAKHSEAMWASVPSTTRVVAECEAMRQIVTGMEALMGHETTYLERMRHTDEQDDVYVIARTTLQSLASIWADHVDYDEDWR